MIMSSLCCFILHFLGRNSTNIDWINNKGGCKMPVYGLWHGIMGVGSNGRTARVHGSKSHRLIPPSHYSMGCYVYGWVVGYEQGNATCNSIWWDAL